jgi:UrcA family protein
VDELNSGNHVFFIPVFSVFAPIPIEVNAVKTQNIRRFNMYTMRNRCIATLIILVALVGISGPAGATDPQIKATDIFGSEVRQIEVRYSDLNLSHRAGVMALYMRINSAATRVCGQRPDIMDLKQSVLWNECRNDALTRAVNDINHPGLAALHNGRTDKPVYPLNAGVSVATKR